MAAYMRRILKAIGRITSRASLRLGSVPSVLYLAAYILLIFSFSAIYFSLPGRPFYHSTSKYEYDEFNADANTFLSDLERGVRSNLVQYYKTDKPKIRDWVLNTESLELNSLSVRNFPEWISFRLFVPLSMVDSNVGRIETQLRQTVVVPLQNKLIVGGVMYIYLDHADSSPSILPVKGIPPKPNLQELFPYVGESGAVRAPVLQLSPAQYNGIVGVGQGYRGFPANVKGQYLRMLYFSAGLATASALGDIVPVTITARLLVTIQALLSLVIAGLFLNSLAVDITSKRKRVRDDDLGGHQTLWRLVWGRTSRTFFRRDSRQSGVAVLRAWRVRPRADKAWPRVHLSASERPMRSRIWDRLPLFAASAVARAAARTSPPSGPALGVPAGLGISIGLAGVRARQNDRNPGVVIDELERYKFITSQLQYYANRMRDSFKLYIQLATAIIGGFVWLKLQLEGTQDGAILSIVPPLLLLLGVLMSALIWFDYVCWYGYRKAESRLIGWRFPPSFPHSAWAEIFMTLAMLSASGVGYWWLRGQG